jgi:hypothetical protein
MDLKFCEAIPTENVNLREANIGSKGRFWEAVISRRKKRYEISYK